jgi:AraC family transcriptional regulator
MSLQSSPSIDSSSLHHLEHRYPLFAEVEIRSPTHDDGAVRRIAPIRFDTTAPTGRTLRVRIEESVFHYFDGRSAISDGGGARLVPRQLATMIDRLSKVLRTEGIDIRRLDRGAENAMRLAVLASLVETLGLTLPGTGRTKVAPALAKWRLVRVLTYVDANIGESISLTHLAAAAGLSRMCFARQFRAATGIRPHEYVLRKRIERAQRMLTETPDSLARIALSVGFQTQAHFTTVFKRIVGNTPRRWRREQPNVALHAVTALGSL